MLQSKKHLPTYNDGIAAIYRDREDNATSFNAPVNVKSLADMDLVVTLAYYECSKREEDFDFAERMSFSLDIKIRTHNIRNVDSECKAVIDGMLYDIGSIDRAKREMFLYLGGGRPIE